MAYARIEQLQDNEVVFVYRFAELSGSKEVF